MMKKILKFLLKTRSGTALCKATVEPVTQGQISISEPVYLKFWYFVHQGFFDLALIFFFTNYCIKIVKLFILNFLMPP